MRSDFQKYSKSIYNKDCMMSAIKAYNKLAQISMTEQDSYYCCKFTKCIVDPQRIMNEFGNYLIELLNHREEMSNK
jgi:hypothetical protein